MYTAHVHFFTNLDLFCIDNARVIYQKTRYLFNSVGLYFAKFLSTDTQIGKRETS